MAMTRKHFVAIANILNRHKAYLGQHCGDCEWIDSAFDGLVEDMRYFLVGENDNFDNERFERACHEFKKVK